MNFAIPTKQPFSFAQTLAFIRRFPPCQGDYVLDADTLTAAIAVDDRAVPFTLRGDHTLVCETELPEVAQRAADFVGASDDLTEFYAAARGDRPFRPLADLLTGLHHVRFLSLEEIAVYAIMMQRNPITRASRMKRAFLDRFGIPVAAGGRTLRAMPRFPALLRLDPSAIGQVIGHPRKGEQIGVAIRGVAAIGEARLREAPYGEARDALLEIPGIGPFSAAAILLRGLGRMDELPEVMPGLDDTARTIYGDRYDPAAIAKRYGRTIGYWSYYLKTGVPRLEAMATCAA
ncbi:MAG: hypothetical protein ABI867_07045 [Kofleriaceae bacterium]